MNQAIKAIIIAQTPPPLLPMPNQDDTVVWLPGLLFFFRSKAALP